MQMSSNRTKPVKVIQFNERFCGKKRIKEENKKENVEEVPKKVLEVESENVKIFNIKKARYEIMRFALNGFDKERRKQDKIAMAIRLGAKPPKRAYKNYKELMEEKKAAKELQKNEVHNKYALQKLKGRKNTKKRKKKDQPSSLI